MSRIEAAFGSAGAAGILGTAGAAGLGAGAAGLGIVAAKPGPEAGLAALALSKKSLPIFPTFEAMLIAALSEIPRASLYKLNEYDFYHSRG